MHLAVLHSEGAGIVDPPHGTRERAPRKLAIGQREVRLALVPDKPLVGARQVIREVVPAPDDVLLANGEHGSAHFGARPFTVPASHLEIGPAPLLAIARRSEESRVGKECFRPCRSRWSPNP